MPILFWLLRPLLSDCTGWTEYFTRVFIIKNLRMASTLHSLPFIVTQRFTPCGKLVAFIVEALCDQLCNSYEGV